MDRCPSQEVIECYAQRLCSADLAQSVEAHIAGCERCARRVESARAGSPDKTDGSAVPGSVTSQTAQAPCLPRPDDVSTLSMPQPSGARSGDREQLPGSPVTFEGYQLLEELPQGGQAVVYKAVHKATKAKVALKVLLPSLTGSAKARQYFRQEVELAASLNHPNIVAIRDSGVSQGQYYFSMNYIHGQPLDRYVQSKALSIREKLALFGKICDAMAHAHHRGVIHRDLKPSNILVDERGEPHILDFGLAKTATNLNAAGDGTVMPTITGQIKGTVAYMSPEQAAGRSDLVDVRTDVYSLGVVLYQMCTGKLPYDVLGTIIEALQNIQYAEPARPRQTISRFNSDVEAIILKSLAKEPDHRYQSAADLKQDVQRWLDGLPIVAKSISSVYLLRKIVARHRYTAAVVTLVLVILCSATCISLFMYKQAEDARGEAQKTAEQALKMAQEQRAIAQQAARFIAGVMARDKHQTDGLGGSFDLYGPFRLDDLLAEVPRASDAQPTKDSGTSDGRSQPPEPKTSDK